MPGCAVVGCKSHNSNTKGTGVILHIFPRNSNIQNVWVTKCRRKDKINISNARICSLHFIDSDYVRDLQSELLGTQRKRVLKQDAVPSINLPSASVVCSPRNANEMCVNSSGASDSITNTSNVEAEGRDKRCHFREVRKRAINTLQDLSPKKKRKDQWTEIESEKLLPSDDREDLLKNIAILQRNNRCLINRCSTLQSRNKELREQLSSTKKQLRDLMHAKDSERKDKLIRLLEKLFSPNQIRCLLKESNRVKWNRGDICRALTLRAVSRKCYCFLRNKLGFPLPSISTLKRWVSRSLRCRPGILQDVLFVMKAQGKRLNERERVCALSFDEMNIDSRICYDSEEDRIVGPHSNVNVVMVRGLFSNWKQVVYFDFDVQMSAAVMKEIIMCLENIDFHVVATVSDMGGKNASVWNELGVTHTNTCFSNPKYPDRRVWVFADVPHLLKLFRNHFLDDGITLENKCRVTKDVIEKLLSLDSNEMKMCPKLSFQHLHVKGRERQRVNLAAQLFSTHTAKAIRLLLPQEQQCADVIELVDQSFDILNSRTPNNEKPLACGYGIHNKEQEACLRKFYALCERVRFGKSQHLLPFQKGFMKSIRSLFGLFNDLKPYKIQYILTSRLNQDCLENFFSRIRGLGHFYDNPSPVDVKYRIRLLLLGANVNDIPLSSSSPVAPAEDGEFVTTTLCHSFLPDMSTALAMVEGDEEISDIVLNEPQPVENSFTGLTDCSVAGFRYIAGYVAYRGRQYDRSLATPTAQAMTSSPDMSMDWIKALSRGGLLVPSPEWLETMSHFEIYFVQVHGQNNLSREPGIIQNMCASLVRKFPEVHSEIIKIYVRTRTFIRLRWLASKDKARKAEEAQRRKAKKWHSSAK